MKNSKLETITASTLIVGVDIAKAVQWARFVDYRGLEIGKALRFKNNKTGFENILTSIKEPLNNSIDFLRGPNKSSFFVNQHRF